MKKHKISRTTRGIRVFSSFALSIFLAFIGNGFVESKDWLWAGIFITIVAMVFGYMSYQVIYMAFKK